MSAAERWAAIDYTPTDGPSWDELSARIGTELRLPRVGDAAMDVTVTQALYWPALGPAPMGEREAPDQQN